MRGRIPRRILLFGKVPAPGRSKTRLAPLLGPEGAAELYAAFLEDTAAAVRGVPGAEAELWLDGRGGAEAKTVREVGSEGEGLGRRLGLPVRWQRGAGLGERLRMAFGRAFREGCRTAVAVGSDHPTLPASRIEEAFGALAAADVSIGPSEDGGYYLIGLRRSSWPRSAGLFRQIPWSTPEVLDRTRVAIASLELGARELPAWYDVDEPEDLERLHGDLDPDSRTAAVLGRLLPEAKGGAGRPGAPPGSSRA